MDSNLWNLNPDLSSGKRPAPFALDGGNNILSDHDIVPRATKYPRILEDLTEEDAVLFEHNMPWTPEVGETPSSGNLTSESLSSNNLMAHDTNYHGVFPAEVSDESFGQDKPDVVCFGVIEQHFSNIEANKSGEISGTRSEMHLKISSHRITVHDPDTMEYRGLVAQTLARPLTKLREKHNISFQAFYQNSAEKKSRSKNEQPSRLCMNLYGDSGKYSVVGHILDQAGIFLQHPHTSDLTAPYFNPHYLVRPNGRHPEAISEPQTIATGDVSLNLSANQRLKSSIVQALDCSAQGPSQYSEVALSDSIQTILKPHQLKALSMMAEKESGRLEGNEFEILWHKVDHPDGGVRYRNMITGSTQHAEPRLCRGGLLADDMGLGKTLTMLALIISSTHHSSWSSMGILDSRKRKTTLVVTPLSLLDSWVEQIQRHIDSQKIAWCKYHSSSKPSPADLMTFDLVLTTYDTVAGDRGKQDKEFIGLASYNWHRIVLDEAHIIRNTRSKRHQALLRLKAEHRWCMTGTPIFNQVQDLHALLNFLGAYPFDNLPYFNAHITSLLKTAEGKGMERLKNLFRCIALRRTKDSIKDSLKLPIREDKVHIVRFSPQEHEIYKTLRNSLAYLFFSTTDTEANKSKLSGGVLPTITRLRRFCNHKLDLLSSEIRNLIEDLMDGHGLAQALMSKSKKCDTCSEESASSKAKNGPVIQSFLCGHNICSRCQNVPSAFDQICPVCAGVEAPPTVSNKMCSDQPLDALESYQPSSKVVALLNNIATEQAAEPSAKCVIFSCWTGMLDLVGMALTSRNLGFQRIDGRHTEERRREALKKFRTTASCTVLLASMGSAGVGLDLTAASHIHLLEPQWSPMAEEQAIDRVHRMGQTRPVTVNRYYVKDSIEEHVVLVQRNKHKLIAQSMDLQQDTEKVSLMDCLKKHLEGA